MTYHEWLERFASLTPETRANLRRKILVLDHQPLISVILPVYNSDLKFLEQAIASVRRQIYENWEVCVADDASTDLRIKPFLENLTGEDRRIKVLFRDKNGHISACSNSALSLARGEWCALLDQDDELAEDALAEVACEIRRNPDAAIVYSDEDFLDANGARSNPFFKPDWNPELFLAQNYLNHLGVYRTSLLHEIGGFREGFEGSQDYDLALRCVARVRSEQIRHIPRILYHWRMVRGSLAEQPDAKPYARHAARRALNSYLHARGIAAHAEACPQNAESHRVVYQLPNPLPKVTVISSAETDEFERAQYPGLEIIRMPPGAAAMNAGAARAQADVLVFARRPIAAMENGWLREIVSHVVRPEVGAVGARLWSPEGERGRWRAHSRSGWNRRATFSRASAGASGLFQSRLAAAKFFGCLRRVPRGAAVSLCRGRRFQCRKSSAPFLRRGFLSSAWREKAADGLDAICRSDIE